MRDVPCCLQSSDKCCCSGEGKLDITPTDDEIPMFPYITAFYSLSTVLLSTLSQLKVKRTLLYYDACVNYAMLVFFNSSLVVVNPSLPASAKKLIITYTTNFMHASSGSPPNVETSV